MLLRSTQCCYVVLLLAILLNHCCVSGKQQNIYKRKVNKEPDAFDKSSCNLNNNILEEIRGYYPTVQRIIDYVTKGDFKGRTYDTLAEFLDTYGPRMTGTDVLENSIDEIIEMSRREKLQNIHTQNITVPHWRRNNESLWMVQPYNKKLNMLGLGLSVGTQLGGITGEVFVVKSFEELKARSSEAAGKIVLFNREFTNYGETVAYRSNGASEASKVGAIAALVRSVAPFSIDAPHTGVQQYHNGVEKIPVACVTMEDAEMMQRMQNRNQTIKVVLEMGAENLPDTVTRNTVVEVKGSFSPEEAVIISGHIDSWDVGQGAMDDGGGLFVTWNAAVALRKLGLIPRRTIKAVFFSAEELTPIGADEYFNMHSHEKDKFQLVLESDIGTFDPQGISFSGSNKAACILQEVMNLMTSINTTTVTTPMKGGPDIYPWKMAGVPTGGLLNSNSEYFWYHHSNGDMMTVEDSDVLDRCTAMWAALAYVTADMSIRLPLVEVVDQKNEDDYIKLDGWLFTSLIMLCCFY